METEEVLVESGNSVRSDYIENRVCDYTKSRETI